MKFTAAIVSCLFLCSCGVAVRQVAGGLKDVRYSSLFETGRRGPLNAAEIEWAKTAWKYFQNNTEGGPLPGGLDKSPVASAWNIGDYLAALNAAHELGAIKDGEFSDRVAKVVQFLNNVELFDKRLPNLYYNVQSGMMTNAANVPQEVGWSAMDLGRLLTWLRITGERLPGLTEYIDKAILRWNFCDVIDTDGSLFAGRKNGDQTEVLQEGRLGYEEYAALGFQAWGFNTRKASQLEPFAKARVEEMEILYDSRDARQSKIPAPVVTLPHVLLGMEFNWGGEKIRPLTGLAQSVYKVQEARYRKEHILTARTDHPLARPPNFVYDTIFLGGYAWNTATTDGTFAPQEALVSTRAAFGMWALYKTDYTQTLIQNVRTLNDPAKGWFEGRFEKTGGPEPTLSSTTNAVVLEALLYRKTGKFFRHAAADGFYAAAQKAEFGGSLTCLPQRR